MKGSGLGHRREIARKQSHGERGYRRERERSGNRLGPLNAGPVDTDRFVVTRRENGTAIDRPHQQAAGIETIARRAPRSFSRGAALKDRTSR